MRALIFATHKEFINPSEKIKTLKKSLKINDVLAEEVDVNSPSGSDQAVTYDVMSFPAVALIREDGTVQNLWQGELPDYGIISQSVGHI
jgi:hypothetical protein